MRAPINLTVDHDAGLLTTLGSRFIGAHRTRRDRRHSGGIGPRLVGPRAVNSVRRRLSGSDDRRPCGRHTRPLDSSPIGKVRPLGRVLRRDRRRRHREHESAGGGSRPKSSRPRPDATPSGGPVPSTTPSGLGTGSWRAPMSPGRGSGSGAERRAQESLSESRLQNRRRPRTCTCRCCGRGVAGLSLTTVAPDRS